MPAHFNEAYAKAVENMTTAQVARANACLLYTSYSWATAALRESSVISNSSLYRLID